MLPSGLCLQHWFHSCIIIMYLLILYHYNTPYYYTDIITVINNNIGKLTATISLDLTHFSNQFIVSGFVTQDAANEILTKLGIGNGEKARQLLHLVTANCRIALNNEEWTDKFITVFSSITTYESLAATLTRATYPQGMIIVQK